MEGVVDWVMRDTLSQIGGIDQFVTEFLRVTDKLHPESVFLKNCPELRTNSRTRHGVPVFVQLLGGQAEPLAVNALRAVKLGALGVDLNFGCPAKTVNRHDGGASLLKSCDRIYSIVKTVRDAVPVGTPVTAKIRLGFEDRSACLDNAKAIEEAGATWLTVHCRSKIDGYKPPAYWDWIPRIREVSKIPIIANGDIWNVEDYHRCQSVTGCDQFMIGRGAMSNPYLFRQIRESGSDFEHDVRTIKSAHDWQNTKTLLPGFFEASTAHINEHFAVSRTKQWLRALSLKSPEAKLVFDQIKTLRKPIEFRSQLENHCV
ncbi:MAG: tRNA-dihydrouridine synthase family protein [Bdellovibrionaceae bacterium]|nr:tRNA-dihydrouridine synthase family protein [Pseudobdellovibrionaceae bacterium]